MRGPVTEVIATVRYARDIVDNVLDYLGQRAAADRVEFGDIELTKLRALIGRHDFRAHRLTPLVRRSPEPVPRNIIMSTGTAMLCFPAHPIICMSLLRFMLIEKLYSNR
jgi:hypothetical protein